MWIKFPAIVGVVLGLVAIKSLLGGFMTLFPMVGVIAAYEARHSLWTMCRQVPVIMLTILPIIAVVRLTAPHLGLGVGLAMGWATFPVTLTALTRRRQAWERQKCPR